MGNAAIEDLFVVVLMVYQRLVTVVDVDLRHGRLLKNRATRIRVEREKEIAFAFWYFFATGDVICE